MKEKTEMKALSLLFIVSIVASATTAGPVWAQHQHEGDAIIGRSDAGRLVLEAGSGGPHVLEPVSGILKGWAGDEPGFEALTADEPLEAFFRLDPGAQIWLEGVSLDPALKARNPLNPLMAVDAPGRQLLLGDYEVHDHVIWHIDSRDPAFNPLQTVWYGTFRLVDKGTTGYAASDPFTINFTTVPEPGTFGLLAIGSWAVLRRQRNARDTGRRRRPPRAFCGVRVVNRGHCG